MGYPGERMPVAYVEAEERPAEERQIERPDVGVLEDIAVVIPVHELIAKGREIDNQCQQGDGSRKRVFTVKFYSHLQPLPSKMKLNYKSKSISRKRTQGTQGTKEE
jgi:hypothetical protein